MSKGSKDAFYALCECYFEVLPNISHMLSSTHVLFLVGNLNPLMKTLELKESLIAATNFPAQSCESAGNIISSSVFLYFVTRSLALGCN